MDSKPNGLRVKFLVKVAKNLLIFSSFLAFSTTLATTPVNPLDHSGTIKIDNSDNITIRQVIDSSANLTKSGGGTLTIVSNSAYSGNTTINDGVLQFGNGGVTGIINSNIINNAVLIFNHSNNLLFSQVISGSGSLIHAGTDVLTLTAYNTYSGGTTISVGTLQIGSGGTLGLISGDVTNHGVLIFNRSDDLTFGDVISGTGSLQQSGAGILILTANQTYTGDTTISNGCLQLGDASRHGMVNGNILNNASLVFNHANSLSYDYVISGSGNVTQSGLGVLTFTADQTYTGITTINSGSLQLGNGHGKTGRVAGDIVNNATLIFNYGDTVVYDGVISGAGDVKKEGAGTLILNGVHTYTGDTHINAGRLLLGGSAEQSDAQIVGDVYVGSRAILGGHGTILGRVTNEGILVHGSSLGTLTIVGDYVQSHDGQMMLEVAGNGEPGLINVTGDVGIAGDLVLNAKSGFVHGVVYNFVNAGGTITGQFDNVNDSGEFNQGFLSGMVDFANRNISITPSFNADAFNAAANTPNLRAAANYLLLTGGTPAIQALIDAAANDHEFSISVNQLSAATYANQQLQLVQTARWFEDELLDHINRSSCRSVQNAIDCVNHPLFWVNPYFNNAAIYSSAAVSGLDTNTSGVALGAAFPVADHAKLGVAFAGSHFSGHATGQQESASDEGMLYQFGVYGDYTVGDFIFGASVAFSSTDSINANRNIDAIDNVVTVTSDYNDTIFSQQVGARYDWALSNIHIQPFLALVHQQLGLNGFSEKGDMDFALTIGESNYDSLLSELGVGFEAPLQKIIARGALSWAHEFEDNQLTICEKITTINRRDCFNVQSATIGRDRLQLTAGFSFFQQQKIHLSIVYQGFFADSYRENGVKIQIDSDFGE